MKNKFKLRKVNFPALACLKCVPFTILFASTLTEASEAGSFSNSASSIDWFEAKGEFRLRYESLDGQFRAGRSGSDQLLATRALAQLKADFNLATFNVELQDSRSFLDDEGTPLSTSFVNTLEFINFNADLHLGSLFGSRRTDLKVGRQTVDVGSERFIERNGYRNTINSYDGAHLRTIFSENDSFETFFVAPVRAQPRDFESLANNSRSFDKTDQAIRFWGSLYTNEKKWIKNTKTELFAYGLHEQDTDERATADREIYTLGFRLLKRPSISSWDYEVEYAYQFGNRLASAEFDESSELRVEAQTLHAELAYTFDTAWQWRLAFEFDFASGDDDPNDEIHGSYDRLFGSRRGDVGFTSIHGPLVRNNLVLPGIDIEFKPGPSTDGFISYQQVYLDSARDELDAANLRDITGEAGSYVGETLDMRLRHWIIPGKLRWDIGASALFNGSFLEDVPDGPEQSRTLYGFTQFVTKF